MFSLTPDLLEMMLTRMGVAAGQLKNIDAETKKALVRFVMTAVGSGDANGYIKQALAHIAARDETASEPPPPRNVRVTSRPMPVEGEFVGDEPKPPSRDRRRK